MLTPLIAVCHTRVRNAHGETLGSRHYTSLHEFRILLVLGIVLVGIWGFVELAEMVSEGETHTLDTALLLALRDPLDPGQALGPPWMGEIMRDITALGGTAVLSACSLALGVVGYLALLQRHDLALLVFVAVGGAMLLNLLLKLGFDCPRPDLVPHLTEAYQTSFPSGHSMSLAATYLTLGAMLARAQAAPAAQDLLYDHCHFYHGAGWLQPGLPGRRIGQRCTGRLGGGRALGAALLAGGVVAHLEPAACRKRCRQGARRTGRVAPAHAHNPA